jgi:hypothetical protein
MKCSWGSSKVSSAVKFNVVLFVERLFGIENVEILVIFGIVCKLDIVVKFVVDLVGGFAILGGGV